MVTSIPVMSFIPTPKKRESFAARRRRMRNIGSEGLTSDALSGLARPGEIGEGGGNWDVGGEAGADTDREELPHWNMVTKGGGLTARNTPRIGDGKELWEVNGVWDCCEVGGDWAGIDEDDTTEPWLGHVRGLMRDGREKGDVGRRSVPHS